MRSSCSLEEQEEVTPRLLGGELQNPCGRGAGLVLWD